MKKSGGVAAGGQSKLLTDAIPAWGKSRNEIIAEILWRFTTDDARTTLRKR